MKALGIHTYMGGMQIGASRVFDVLGSAESWKDALNMRAFLGLETRGVKDFSNVDVVFANPPCSRFSISVLIKFTDEQRSNVGEFDCLGEVLDFAKGCNARTMWWETGPHAFTKGAGIINGLHAAFGAHTTWVLKINTKHIGIPQDRPRVHVIHFKDPVGSPDRINIVDPQCVRQWLAARCSSPGTPAGPDEVELAKWGCKTTEEYCYVQQSVMTFSAFEPKIIDKKRSIARAILSRPQSIDNRWLTLEESAELMGYPQRAAQFELDWWRMLRLMSKGVSANMSEFVASKIRMAMEAPKCTEPAVWNLDVQLDRLTKTALAVA